VALLFLAALSKSLLLVAIARHCKLSWEIARHVRGSGVNPLDGLAISSSAGKSAVGHEIDQGL
jgi:hypothetical protein